jgi:DNA replicative helicase MCM subunit Mcm2 (Cdc46/Mcm family)
MSKSARRFSKASGSTKRRVERIIRLGERAAKRALSARQRREFVERLDYAK